MTAQYQDRIALVTGASSGLGWEIARELARRGATVAVVARRADRLEQLVADIAAEGGQAKAFSCDVTDEKAVEALASQVKAQLGQLHLLVNNAGKELMVPLSILKTQDARELLEVNVLSTAIVTRECLGLLKQGSAIVNMSSALGIQGAAAMSIYCATKGAIIALTQALAKELAPRKIRVNAVAPGMVKTDLLDRVFSRLKPEQVAALEAKHPLGLGLPRDVATVVAFLGSSDAAWMTGQTIAVDGGLTA